MAILGSLLSGLGAGLRAGGGVLSPDVFAHNEQRRAAELQRADAQRSDMFKYVWSGMQDGSIDPQKGMQVLGQLDPQMAGQIAQHMGDSAFQPSYAAREKMLTAEQKAREMAREEQDWAERRAALEGLGFDPGTPDSVVAAKLRAQSSANTDKAQSSPGKLAADYRAGLLSKDEYEALRRKATYIRPPSAGRSGGGGGSNDAFGKGMEGRAHAIILSYNRLKRAGKPIPDDLQVQYEVAQNILAGQADKRKAATSGGDDETAKVIGAIESVAGILDEAAAEGETVTGVKGTAKRWGGGLARQVGVPVSPRAEQLSRGLQRLQAVAGPMLLKDSRLSNEERARVNQIVGNVDAFTDDVALRQSLADLAAIVGGNAPREPLAVTEEHSDDALINKYLR